MATTPGNRARQRTLQCTPSAYPLAGNGRHRVYWPVQANPIDHFRVAYNPQVVSLDPAAGRVTRLANDVQKLLQFIAHHYIARQEAIELERDASAAEQGENITADKRRVVKQEEDRAEALSDPFREGLRRADDARRAGGNAISLDDRKPEEDQQADALIHFLVRSQLATSTSRETDQHRYIYTIAVDWDALDRVAREARVNLASVLGRSG